MEAKVDSGALADRERCTRLSAQTAIRNAKSLSSLQKADQSTARIAIRSTRSFNLNF
jgi:hypothetical protein